MKVKSRTMGRPKGKCLTANYSAVLQKVANEGFQSYPELRSTVLQSMTRQSSWKVLKKLYAEGLLSECRGDGGGIRGWALSRKGQALLQSKGETGWSIQYHYPLYRTAFDHDVILREVRSLLIESPKMTHWIPEHVLKSETMREIQHLNQREKVAKLTTVPDALIQFKIAEQTFKAAIELELTRKSHQRLVHRFESHMTHSKFDFVFFIVKDENLLEVLWNAYQEVLTQAASIRGKSKLNGIYFVLLESLRTDRLKAKFVGQQNTFTFE